MDEVGRGDPDSRARTHLANERTFLAWLRTGLTLVALGLVGGQFLTLDIDADFPLVRVLSTVAVLTGVFLVLVGAQRYVDGRRRIDAADFRPAQMSVLLTAGAAAVAGILAVRFIWLVPGR